VPKQIIVKDKVPPHLFSVAYITLGCKVNQYETEQTRCTLEKLGFTTVSHNDAADVYIINTCSVTNTADSKSRAAIRKSIRTNPDALIIVTGCYSQLEPLDVASIEGVDMVVPNDQKDSIPDYITARLGISSNIVEEAAPVTHRTRTRAVIKVQDGCDNYCSYCIIPYARPHMTSRPLQDVIDEIKSLVDAGFCEIVLTGIRLGAYRWDKLTIADLVRHISMVNGIGRIRLSSIEPWEITDSLLDAMDNPKVCRHLHIPLQSGDDDILAAMNRRYDTREYLRIIERIRNRITGIGITTDIIAGFPGEDIKAFENSMNTVREASFTRLHVFRFSPRNRTTAIDMTGQVTAQEKQRRSELLEKLGLEQQQAFARSWVREILPVILESETKSSCVFRGYTDNYIEVNVLASHSNKNRIVNVRILDAFDNGFVSGELVV